MKPCLLISEIPLKSGEDHTAPCGKKLVKAEWVCEAMLPGGSFRLEPEIRRVTCPRCLKSLLPAGRYLYLAVDGERVKQMEEA